MKRRIQFFAFMLLTASAMRSQDTTDVRPVVFPFWMVQEIALDLEEKDRLEAEVQLLWLELQAYKSLVSGLEKNEIRRSQQVEILQRHSALLHTQLQARQVKKSRGSSILLVLQLLGALGMGYIVGRI